MRKRNFVGIRSIVNGAFTKRLDGIGCSFQLEGIGTPHSRSRFDVLRSSKFIRSMNIIIEPSQGMTSIHVRFCCLDICRTFACFAVQWLCCEQLGNGPGYPTNVESSPSSEMTSNCRLRCNIYSASSDGLEMSNITSLPRKPRLHHQQWLTPSP